MPTPQSICILRLSALGDVCNAVAAVQAIQQSYPSSKLTWVIGKLEYQLVKALPNIEFIVFDKKQTHAFSKFKHTMQGRKFDVLLHMQVALRANWLARLIPANTKIGYDWKRAKEGHSLVTNKRIAPLTDNTRQHVLDSFLAFAKAIGVSEEACYPPRWTIPISTDDIAYAQSIAPSNLRTLVICPAASKKERCWLSERYAEVADYADQQGWQVLLCGGPSDLDITLAQDIINKTQAPVRSLVGETTLAQLYALLSQASIVLAPDTGPLHMANSAGSLVIGLYAHSNPQRTGPYNNQEHVVSAYRHFLKLQYNKRPDDVSWGQRVKGEDLMAFITTDAVIAQFNTLNKQLSDAPSLSSTEQ